MVPVKTLAVNPPSTEYLFSICTIVNNMQEYILMKQSFEQCGFTEECEYIIADNCAENNFDAYVAIKRFILQAAGKYIIVVHQDVRCIDSKKQLVLCLDNLTATDVKWGLCGNAGVAGYHEAYMHINNAGKIIKTENLPARVMSLDENLLIINKASGITVSGNLSGFHLYGTDLCIVAELLGYNCYVIPFMVKHLSLGNLEDLERHVKAFIESYGKKLKSRYVETTCTKFYLGNSVFKNKVLNYGPVFSLVKSIQRIKQIFKWMRTGNNNKKSVTVETNGAPGAAI